MYGAPGVALRLKQEQDTRRAHQPRQKTGDSRSSPSDTSVAGSKVIRPMPSACTPSTATWGVRLSQEMAHWALPSLKAVQCVLATDWLHGDTPVVSTCRVMRCWLTADWQLPRTHRMHSQALSYPPSPLFPPAETQCGSGIGLHTQRQECVSVVQARNLTTSSNSMLQLDVIQQLPGRVSPRTFCFSIPSRHTVMQHKQVSYYQVLQVSHTAV
jgi:hypothetical protein